jgi:hypothetical protein
MTKLSPLALLVCALVAGGSDPLPRSGGGQNRGRCP